MKTLAEARAYAENRKAKGIKVKQYIMTNDERYVVAYGKEDMEYGKELGYRVVELV